jgi:hypothetical protein
MRTIRQAIVLVAVGSLVSVLAAGGLLLRSEEPVEAVTAVPAPAPVERAVPLTAARAAMLAPGNFWCAAGIAFGLGAVLTGNGAPAGGFEAVVYWGGSGTSVLNCIDDISRGRAPLATSCGAFKYIYSATQALYGYCDFWDWYKTAQNPNGYPYDFGWEWFHLAFGSAKQWYARKQT